MFLEDEDKGGNDDSDIDDGDEGVNGDSNMDDEDDDEDNDENYYGVEGNEGNEPFNDDKGRDSEVGENIGNEGNVGIFDWNEIDAEIEETNRDRAQRLYVPQSEESDCLYSPAPCHDRLSKHIEDDENAVLNHNNNIRSHVDDENENGASVDNEDNNNKDEINGVVAPIIQKSPPHPPIERGSSSKSVLTFNDSSDRNAGNSRRLVYTKSMDVDPLPSLGLRTKKPKVQLVYRSSEQYVVHLAQ